jgi:cysteine desulfurase
MSGGTPTSGRVRHQAVSSESYLDWNATSPLRPEAAAAISAILARCGNPSSVHRWGRVARQTIESARQSVAALLGSSVDPSDVIFVSGGTEANHLALLGPGRDRVLVSAVEHRSVLDVVPAAEMIPVDTNGLVSLDALDELLAMDPRRALVSVMLANNETGVIQPVADIAGLAQKHGALFHCDAVQAAGKITLDVDAIGADLVSVSAHKLGGPPGVGALAVTSGLDLLPLFRGGGQERGRRAGTENLPGIAGFGAAASVAAASMAVYHRIRELRDILEAEIAVAAPDAVVIGAAAPRLPNTSAIAMPGIAAETQVIALDLDGVMVSAGSACSAGKVEPSHVLAAMAVGPELVSSTIRVSLGWSSSEADIGHFLGAWMALYRRRRGRSQGMRAA